MPVRKTTKAPLKKQLPNSTSENVPVAVAPVDLREIAKKPQLIEKVTLRTGMKKKDAKFAIEATLASIAELLETGHDLSVPPLGKIRVVKEKTNQSGATIFTAKIRTNAKAV